MDQGHQHKATRQVSHSLGNFHAGPCLFQIKKKKSNFYDDIPHSKGGQNLTKYNMRRVLRPK